MEKEKMVSDGDLQQIIDDCSITWVLGYLTGAGGKVWGKMKKDNPHMRSSAINN